MSAIDRTNFDKFVECNAKVELSDLGVGARKIKSGIRKRSDNANSIPGLDIGFRLEFQELLLRLSDFQIATSSVYPSSTIGLSYFY